MTAIEQADALTQEAVELLLAERQQIDDRLHQLGHADGAGQKKTTLGKKRGRPSKLSQPSPLDTTPVASPSAL